MLPHTSSTGHCLFLRELGKIGVICVSRSPLLNICFIYMSSHHAKQGTQYTIDHKNLVFRNQIDRTLDSWLGPIAVLRKSVYKTCMKTKVGMSLHCNDQIND